MEQTAMQRAIQAVGGQERLATAIGVHRSLISQWVTGRRPVAATHCPLIEAASGVPCEQLRPDLDWLRDEAGVVTGYCVRFNDKKNDLSGG